MPYTPHLGGNAIVEFPRPLEQSEIDPRSFCCTLVEQLSNDGSDTVISHGSGCFWVHNECTYLVTARHILCGRSPFDNTLLSRRGFVPQRIAVYPMLKNGPHKLSRFRVILNLDQEEQNWLQDPEFQRYRTDIAAVQVGGCLPSNVYCLNQFEIFFEMFTHVGTECAVVGYPTPHFGGPMTPTWRKGAIASEPYLPVDGKPMFLLDAATSPGFSGSPVFRQHFGPLPVVQPDGSRLPAGPP